MITVASKDSCSYCKHIRSKKDGWKACCDAYPDGMPNEYLFERVDVSKLGECAPGYKFEPDLEKQRVWDSSKCEKDKNVGCEIK